MANELQNRLSHRAKRKGVLVPLLEDLFQNPVEIESEQDVEFLTRLLRTMVERQKRRGSAPLYSPSQLASCLRYVYLLKHHREHGISRQKPTRVQPNFFFFNGNFLHLKWQFALWKLDQAVSDEKFKLLGCEIPIISKHKDHGGTVDALVLIRHVPYIVDFKGLNVRSFSEITRGKVPRNYLVQLADYGMLFNSLRLDRSKVTHGLLVTENKGGADNTYPTALHETPVKIDTYLPEVRWRLEELRSANGEIPPPECTSPHQMQFTSCPFRGFCKVEVTKRFQRDQKEQRKTEPTLATSTRTRRRVK